MGCCFSTHPPYDPTAPDPLRDLAMAQRAKLDVKWGIRPGRRVAMPGGARMPRHEFFELHPGLKPIGAFPLYGGGMMPKPGHGGFSHHGGEMMPKPSRGGFSHHGGGMMPNPGHGGFSHHGGGTMPNQGHGGFSHHGGGTMPNQGHGGSSHPGEGAEYGLGHDPGDTGSSGLGNLGPWEDAQGNPMTVGGKGVGGGHGHSFRGGGPPPWSP
jgi:hypothetical protein